MLTILTKPTQRQLINRLNFHLRLIRHTIALSEGDSDPRRQAFVRESLALEAAITRRLIRKLGGRAEEKTAHA
ncbi:MAG TPA: hypothetical protein VHC90_11395 [Bryobacteraceae bacterium]|nr:hypothetical protein [Bryobacteraceae bacterium]